MTEPGGVILLLLLGLAVGSFLNVCIVRLPEGLSVVRPRSRCLACRRGLRWFENIPVLSFAALRGRCRTCLAPISPVYPIVEVITPVLFLLEYDQLGWRPLLAVRLVFCCAMVVLFVIDLQHRVLPNVITLPGIGVGLVASLAVDPGWWSAVMGVVIGGGGLLLVAEVYYRLRHEEGLGMGDVKMLAMIGAFLGWQLMLATLLLASLLGSVVGVAMLVLGLGDSKYALPLGSFLAVAAVVMTIAGESFLVWYIG